MIDNFKSKLTQLRMGYGLDDFTVVKLLEMQHYDCAVTYLTVPQIV